MVARLPMVRPNPTRSRGRPREAATRAAGALGGVVAVVADASPAARAGVRRGDRIVAVDGLVIRDVIDFQAQTQGRRSTVVDVERGGVLLAKRVVVGDADIGVDFEQPTFDGLRECNNACEFCFIRGLPKGLRRSLYVRDDDYRYSFLYGSFVTLTNLEQEDWDRIAFQRLSPLRVSVHATDPTIRARLLSHPGAPPILPQLRRLGEAGIRVHAQIVLCPGINDGTVLDQTIEDLGELDDVVESVAVVPVGISEHLRVRDIRAVSASDADRALTTVTGWNRRFRGPLGRGLVYPSDELFLLAAKRLPGEAFYDGYPQLQNGVGLTRLMIADWHRARVRLPVEISRPVRMAWVCGPAAREALGRMAAEARRVGKLDVDVVVVESSLFGKAITVSGLMAGRDAARALTGRGFDVAVLPRSAFGFEGQRTLDEWTADEITNASGVPVMLGASARDLVAIIREFRGAAGQSPSV